MKQGTRLTDEQRRKIAEMYEKGYTWGEIAKKFDISINRAHLAARMVK